MSSLELTKTYGLDETLHTLTEKTRTRLVSATPHQAPQRERVSRAVVASKDRPPSGPRGGKRASWKEKIDPYENLGVPTLMLLLEPKIVFDHVKTYIPPLRKDVEAQITQNEFYEGWHRGGRPARGVYEGAYWELMGDCQELMDMLRKMAAAPPLLDEPSLELPEAPDMPKWEDFKPTLMAVPPAPVVLPLKLPPYKAPMLQTELPFVEPEYLPLPAVGDAPREVPILPFEPPKPQVVDPFREPDFVEPKVPAMREAPRTPAVAEPKYGHDWTGERPFTVPEAVKGEHVALNVPAWHHPPRGLPQPPTLRDAEKEAEAPQLEVQPVVELAWVGGPEPEPAYASASTTPQYSPSPSRPMSAARSSRPASSHKASRPDSALQPPASRPGSAVQPPASRPASAVQPPAEVIAAEPEPEPAAPEEPEPAVPESTKGSSKPPSTDGSTPPEGSRPQSAARPLSGKGPASRATSSRSRPASAMPSRAPIDEDRPMTAEDLDVYEDAEDLVYEDDAEPEDQWEAAQDVEGEGAPRLWLNFEPPFSEPAPVILPDRPTARYPEPLLEDYCTDPGNAARCGKCGRFGHTAAECKDACGRCGRMGHTAAECKDACGRCGRMGHTAAECKDEPMPASGNLKPMPVFMAPAADALPQWVEPSPFVEPAYISPCEPRPIGFMRGLAPVLLMDVSGTMNPRCKGHFPDMKDLCSQLLDPAGELATSAHGFDVIAFSNGAYSWSATYESRQALLKSAQVQYSGRQAGCAPRRGAGVAQKGKGGVCLQPTEPEFMEDAQRWVQRWPEAVGHTNLLSAFRLAGEHWAADCWYLLSDGLANDAGICLDWVSTRLRHNLPMPAIHTVCFFPENAPPDNFAGERFLKELSQMTGGTYQRFEPDVYRIYRNGRFEPYDPAGETPEQREERAWTEEQLRQERRKNVRLGIVERIEVTLNRIRGLYRQLRIQPLEEEHRREVARLRAAYDTLCRDTTAANQARLQAALAAHQAACQEVEAENAQYMAMARARWEEDHKIWEDLQKQDMANWLAECKRLEAQHEAEVAAYNHMVAQREEEVRRAQQARLAEMSEADRLRHEREARRKDREARLVERQAKLAEAAAGVAPSPAPLPPPLAGEEAVPPPQHAAETTPTPLQKIAPGSAGSVRPSTAAASVPVAAPAAGQTSRPGTAAASVSAAASAAGEASRPGTAAASVSAAASAAGEASRPGTAAASVSAAASVAGEASRPGTAAASVSAAASVAGEASRPSTAPLGATERPTSARPVSSSRPTSGVPGHYARPLSGGSARPLSGGSARPVSGGGMRPMSAVSVASSARSTGLPPAAFLQTLPPAALAAVQPGKEMTDDEARKLVPAEVVAEINDLNAEDLAGRREEWAQAERSVDGRSRLQMAAAARNAELVANYEDAVADVYADSFVMEVVCTAAVRSAVNEMMFRAIEDAYLAAKATVAAENARLAALHAAEVAEKKARDKEYMAALAKWEADRATIMALHKEQVAKAAEAHKAAVVRQQRTWEQRKADTEAANAARLEASRAEYDAEVAAIKEHNKAAKAEYAEVIKARRSCEKENAIRLAEAKAAHREALEQLGRDNEQRLEDSQVEHAELCERMKADHEEALKAAAQEHESMKAEVGRRNEVLLEEARKRYQDAVMAAQEQYEIDCRAARALYESEIMRVRQYNEGIWPQVELAKLAELELGRVQAFFEHIHYCANKVGSIGVNFYKGMPCYDRVVEMLALTEALAKAYPDMLPDEYPWPGHDRKDAKGSGWKPSPVPVGPLAYRDPMYDLMAIANGRRPASADIRTHNAYKHSRVGSSGPAPTYHAEEHLVARPQTAGAGTSKGVSFNPISRVGASGEVQVVARPFSGPAHEPPLITRSLSNSSSRQGSPEHSRPGTSMGSVAGDQQVPRAATGSPAARPGTASSAGAKSVRALSAATPLYGSSGRRSRQAPARSAADTTSLNKALSNFAHSTGSKLGATAFTKDMPRPLHPQVDVDMAPPPNV